MSKIYIPYNNGLDYDECYLINTSIQYKNCLLEEIIFNEELDSELKDKALREQNQNNIDLEKEIDKIVKQAKKQKSKDIDYNKSPTQKLRGIKKNRAVEKEVNRQDEAFSLGKDIAKADRVAEIIELPTAKKESEETGYNKLMDLIKKKRGEKSGK